MAYWACREGRAGRRWIAASFFAAILGCASSVFAQTTADDLARTHFESGAAYLEQSEYESALREFTSAYDLSKRPEILINIATVHERMGNLDKAIASLEEYLKAAPTGEHADVVKVRLNNLKERQAKIGQQKEQTPATTPAPAAAQPQATSTSTTASPPPEADQATGESSKIPAYALFAVAGVSAAGSILTGVLAQGEHSDLKDSCAPNCTDDEVSTGKTLAITSTILTGVAVVTGAIGAVLFFGSSSEEHAQHHGPQVGFAVTPHAGLANARWRF